MPKNGERGPDQRPRKGSPRLGKKAEVPPPPDDSPSRARRAQALDLLSQGRSPYKVAEEMGVHHGTIYDWLRRPEFAAELDARIAEGREVAMRSLRASAATAAETLREVAESGDQYDGPRVKAAEAILDRIGLPVDSRVQVQVSGRLDVAKLTEAELEQLVAEEAARLAAAKG